MLRWAYEDAGVAPADVDFVEAHGTGTPVIDPVELVALGAVLGEGRPPERPCLVGSIKTNIGHAQGAAGIAGLIKAVLCLEHRVVPPSLHFTRPNPAVPWDELPLQIPTKPHALADLGRPAVCGVSGQGLSSVNTHIVLRETTELGERSRDRARPGRPHLLARSARTATALGDLARA